VGPWCDKKLQKSAAKPPDLKREDNQVYQKRGVGVNAGTGYHRPELLLVALPAKFLGGQERKKVFHIIRWGEL